MEKKFLTLAFIALLGLGMALLVGSRVLAEDENEGKGVTEEQVTEVNNVSFNQVDPNVGKFGMIGTITAVSSQDKTIAVNGVTVDVSGARLVGWRWKQLMGSLEKPWKDWWKDWSLDELKVGDKVRVGGTVEGGKLMAKWVVLHAFRIVEKVKQCTVNTDCPTPPSGMEFRCVENKCKLKRIGGEEAGATTTKPSGTIGPVKPQVQFQSIQEKLNEILQKIQELQSKLGTVTSGGANQ
jgi:hypothetical protein